MTQFFEEIEGRVTNKLSQELSRTENRILCALYRPDDFNMNSLIQSHPGTAPETSRNAFSTNQGTKEDDSQSDLNSEVGIVHNHTTQNSGPEDGHDSNTKEQAKVSSRLGRYTINCWERPVREFIRSGDD